jgi:thioredoxin-related protein
VKRLLPVLLGFSAASAFASGVGESYEQLVAEKGKPIGVSEAGSLRILTYPDAIIRMNGDAVVSIRPNDKASTITVTPVAPQPVVKREPVKVSLDGPALWETDLSAAMDQARDRQCHILMLYTGSDWDPWSKKMDAEVYSQPEFARYSRQKFVLLKIDYPQHAFQSDALKTQNAELLDRYKIDGYPYVVVVDAKGKILTKLEGYQEGGPAHFITLMQPFE